MAKRPIPSGAPSARPKPPKPKPTPPFPGGPKPGGKPKPKPKPKPAPAPAPAPPAPPPPGSGFAVSLADKAAALERLAAIRAKGAGRIAAIKRGRTIKKYAKAGGIAALAGLGAGIAYNRGSVMAGTSTDQLMNKALYDLMGQQRQMQMNALVEDAKADSYEDAITRNLQRIQQNAPDLYMAVAAGRRLPTGAVVLGGTQRTDLLQDLGRSMSDGQYS